MHGLASSAPYQSQRRFLWAAGALQLLNALPAAPLLIQIANFSHNVGDALRILSFYGYAPLSLVLTPVLWARKEWAWRISLALVPWSVFGPLVFYGLFQKPAHGGELLTFGPGFISLMLSPALLTMLLKAR